MQLFRKEAGNSLIIFSDPTIQVVIRFMSIAAVLGLIIVFLGGYAYFQIFQHIVPGVYAGKTNLTALNTYDAAVRLNKDWNMERRITLGIMVNGDIQTVFVAPSELGLSIDAVTTANLALDIGHNQGYFVNTEQFARGLFYGWEITPQVFFDPIQARKGLQTISQQFYIPPQEASLIWDGINLTTVPEAAGYAVDLEAALNTLTNNPEQVLFEKLLPLTAKSVYPQSKDVTKAKTAIENWLNLPITISAYDAVNNETINWIIPIETKRSWVEIEDGLNLLLNENLVSAYLSSLSELIGVGRHLNLPSDFQAIKTSIRSGNLNSLIIHHDPTSYTVQPGETLLRISWKVGIPYWRITQANPGINPDKLNPGQLLIIPSKDDLIPLPIILNKRVVISISQQRLWTYQSGQLRSEHIISTGIDRSPTQPGVFQVQTHELNAYASVWDLYMPHFLGIYEAWPGFMNGIHGLPTLSNGTRLWESILGKPASFGCIILNLADAEDLYNWAEDGVIVEILP